MKKPEDFATEVTQAGVIRPDEVFSVADFFKKTQMKINRLAQFISPRWREAQRCESCGEDFTCGAALTGCWCVSIKLSDETRALLKERFQQCLCRNCLEKFSQSPLSIEAQQQQPLDERP